MTETVGIAVVGTGDWGANLVRGFAALPGARLAVLCDTDPGRLSRTAARHPSARATARIDEVTSAGDVQGVVVSASAAQHHAIARAALEAGKDVFVEKPLALRVDHAEELVRMARERDRILMVGHLLLHHPCVTYLKDLVGRGELGEVLYIYSQRVNLGKVRRDENALWSFAPHDLSVVMHLLEAEPVEVAAHGASFLQSTVEDVVFLHLRFPGNRLAHVHVSWLDPHKLRKFTVVGRDKMVVFDDMEANEKIRVYDKGIDPAGRILPYGDALGVRSGDIVIPNIAMQEPLRIECQHFVDCVRERRTPLTDGADGLRVVRVLAAAQRSLETRGAPVPLTAQPVEAR